MGKDETSDDSDSWRARCVCLVFDSAELSSSADEPDDFLREYTGRVTIPGEDWDEVVEVGRFRAFYAYTEAAVNERISIFDLFDTRSETIGFYALYDEDHCFNEATRKAAKSDYSFDANLLILDRLEIFPPHRGKSYGLKALVGLIHWLQPGAGMVAMKPFPLQFEASVRDLDPEAPDPMALKQFKGTFMSARAKLRRHYAKLGFRLVAKTDFMVRAVDLPLPRLLDN